MRPTVVGALAGAAVLAAGAGIWIGVDAARRESRVHQQVAVPAYWTPDDVGGHRFDTLAAARPTVGLVVVNGPTSSAPVPFDAATAAQVRKLHRAGIRVLGYVDTGFLGSTGMRTTRVDEGSTRVADWRAQAEHDAATWFGLYGAAGLDGIFLDQTVSSCGDGDVTVEVYRALVTGLRRAHPGLFVAMNPGTETDECYAEVADTLLIFENTWATYRQWSLPAWVSRYPARRFWHLVYDVPSARGMREAVALSKQRNAGFVYVTDDVIDDTGSPWDTLPPQAYWADELRLARQPA